MLPMPKAWRSPCCLGRRWLVIFQLVRVRLRLDDLERVSKLPLRCRTRESFRKATSRLCEGENRRPWGLKTPKVVLVLTIGRVGFLI